MSLQCVLVPRTEWGASRTTEQWIANRRKRLPSSKTEVHIHHTAAVDQDDTPNRWAYDDAANYMRRLQHVRPDLGPLPYSENIALSEDGETVWFFEGRGLQVTGAHTGGHNIPGLGFGFLGNFGTDGAGRGIPALTWRLRDLRDNHGYVNLGNTKSPDGWDVWGHRDTKSTACPGTALYRRLREVQFTGPAPPTFDPPDPWAKEAWEKAKTAGVVGPQTDPHDDVQKQELMAFFDRLGLLDPGPPDPN